MSHRAAPKLFANAAYRLHKGTLAQATGYSAPFRERALCWLGRHKWMLDGGSVDEPRYADDEQRYFCARAYCLSLKGNWPIQPSAEDGGQPPEEKEPSA